MHCALVAEVDKRLEESVTGFFIQNLSHNLLLEENGKKLKVIGYVSTQDSVAQKKIKLADFLFQLSLEKPHFFPGKASVRYEKEFDWVAQSKKGFRPRQIAPDCWVAPPWKRGSHKNEIIIEPKMAFGTGEHATTQLCCQAAAALVRPGMKVLDFGTGSGILAILAAKLGASKIVGIDNDSLAVENAQENITLNKVSKQIQLRLGSFEKIQNEKYDLIFANLILSQIISFFPHFTAALKPVGFLVASGILTHQLPQLKKFLTRRKAELIALGRDSDWACLVIAP